MEQILYLTCLPVLWLNSGINSPIILLSNFEHMPNWNFNRVCIQAPLAEVEKFLSSTKDNRLMFNMHLLFPERFWPDDLDWEKNWDYEWACKNTGSKWFPDLYFCEADGCTEFLYNTAREPNIKTLEKLSKLWGWTILLEYEEPGLFFEWIAVICEWEILHNHRSEYRPPCSVCDEKFNNSDLIENEHWENICKNCNNKAN